MDIIGRNIIFYNNQTKHSFTILDDDYKVLYNQRFSDEIFNIFTIITTIGIIDILTKIDSFERILDYISEVNFDQEYRDGHLCKYYAYGDYDDGILLRIKS